ncbi:MAG: hypothetical protein ACJA0I_001508 [Gammaproteobacteria bacterium]|jgi:hypothetical protein
MTGALSDIQRNSFAEISNVVYPGGYNHPPSSGLDLKNAPLDHVLRARNELVVPLIKILNQYVTEPNTFLSQLEDHDFKLIMIIISASYLSIPQVKDSLEYNGQQAMTLGRAGFGAEELVFELMQQPKRYRDV